jgi:excisionase family DNA binding protein
MDEKPRPTERRHTPRSKADPQIQMAPMPTPPEVAKRLRVAVNKIMRWIKLGELMAFNVAATGSRLPRWRIDPTDLDAFMDRRRSQPPAPKPPRRKKTNLPAGFIRYFS